MFRKLLCDASSKENVRKSAQNTGNMKEGNAVHQRRRVIPENLTGQEKNKIPGKLNINFKTCTIKEVF